MTTPPPTLLASLVERLRQASAGILSHYPAGAIERIPAGTMDEAATALEALAAENGALKAALTASTETKAAYMSEFSWREPDFDDCGGRTYRHNVVPWTTIKEIMSAILARATLNGAPQP